jgi:Fe-S-cluster-containing dehydrogenase component
MDNGKKRFDLDLDRCVGCFACVVACMDQNDINPDEGDIKWRNVFEIDRETSDKEKISYISLACMHCDDPACVMACPTGAIKQDEITGITVVDTSICIGCHSCAMGCPNGAPKFSGNGKMEKCKGCIERVENGLIPSCVRVCPTRALKYDTEENIQKLKINKTLRKIIND